MAFLRRRTRHPDDAGSDTTEFAALMEREWQRLAHAGTWFTGAERVAIAAAARGAVHDRPGGSTLPPAVVDAARTVAVSAASIRPADISRWAEGGLDEWSYVELTGIVSRLLALDVAAFGLGWGERALPDPVAGEPTRVRPEDAERTTGWVPTVGPASAPTSLSAVTAEHDGMFDLHGVLYLSMVEMGDLAIERDGLGRPQIELVAARTSMLNDCFY
jgi:hypothetical protein